MIYGVSSLLISAAAGYWVLTHASGEKGRVKKLGQLLGLAIIVVSVVGAGCKLYYQFTGQSLSGKAWCPSGKVCPFSGKTSAPPGMPSGN